MIQTIKTNGLDCLCCKDGGTERIAYILYPMEMLQEWIEEASVKYSTAIVVITGMDWENAITPWRAAGVPKGSSDFKGEAPDFLALLRDKILPEIENEMKIEGDIDRTLVGVSLSGLFTLWQWLICDTFRSIGSLSGSFWYEGFTEWVANQKIPEMTGMAYFLLGDKESKSKVKAFDSVGENTQKIIKILDDHGIRTEFEWVPGTHYDDPIPRLDRAFTALFGCK